MNAFATHWFCLFHQHRPTRIGEGWWATAVYINSLGLYLQWGVSARCAYVVKGPTSWWYVNVHSSGHKLSPWYLTLKYFEALPHSDASGPGFLGWGHLDLHPWSRFFYLMTAAGELRSQGMPSFKLMWTRDPGESLVSVPANDKLLNKATRPLRMYNNKDPLSFHLGEFCAENSNVNVSAFHKLCRGWKEEFLSAA